MKDPNVIAELERIATEHGGLLRPSEVVDAARERSSVLHEYFQWDDSAAAESYRLWQARQLLRVTVEYVGQGDEACKIKVFVSLKDDRKAEGGGYRVTRTVMLDPEQRARLLEQARDDMRYFQKKYAGLKELASVFAAMDAAAAAVTKEAAA